MAFVKTTVSLCIGLACFGAPALAQNPSTPPGASETIPVKPTPPPAKPLVTKPKTKAKTRAKAVEPRQPADSVAATEITKIEPEVTYRLASLSPRQHSVYHKDTDLDQTDQIYATLRLSKLYDYQHEVVIVPRFRTDRKNPVKYDDDYLQEAYIDSQLSSKFALTAGKKTEVEGSGFIVNPSDLLNENQEIFDPMYQHEGRVFVRIRYRLDDFNFALGYIPRRGRAREEGKGWLQMSKEVLGTDVRLQMTANAAEKTTTGLSLQRFFSNAFELHYDGRYQSKQRNQIPDFNGPDQYSTYSGDNRMSYADDTPSTYNLVGSRYVLTPKRSIVLEYIQNQAGLMPDEFEAYYANLRSRRATSDKNVADAPTSLLGRHYVFTTIQDEETVKGAKFSAYYLLNTDDQSAFASVSLRYGLSALTSVELVPSFFTGAVDSEFGEQPFSQATYLVFRGRF